MTSAEEVELAAAAGADALGFIFAPRSARRITLDRFAELAPRVPSPLEIVAVFVDPAEAEVDAVRRIAPRARVQYSGDEPPTLCERLHASGAADSGADGRYYKVFHLRPDGPPPVAPPDDLERLVDAYPHAIAMFDSRLGDARGGTGVPFAWEMLRGFAGGVDPRPVRFVVSGGLTPENVGACVRLLRPDAVDVRSGIETGGAKDRDKMRAFVRAVREADADRS